MQDFLGSAKIFLLFSQNFFYSSIYRNKSPQAR
jgi:hypothetical protein